MICRIKYNLQSTYHTFCSLYAWTYAVDVILTYHNQTNINLTDTGIDIDIDTNRIDWNELNWLSASRAKCILDHLETNSLYISTNYDTVMIYSSAL